MPDHWNDAQAQVGFKAALPEMARLIQERDEARTLFAESEQRLALEVHVREQMLATIQTRAIQVDELRQTLTEIEKLIDAAPLYDSVEMCVDDLRDILARAPKP